MMKWKLFVLLLISLYFSSTGVLAQSDLAGEEIDALMQAHMEALAIPGAALAVVQGDEIVYMQGYGTADDNGRVVTLQTPFALAPLRS